MHIIYAVTTCSDKVYKQLFSNAKKKPIQQAQKYHRLLIEGMAVNAKVDVVANPPVNRGNLSEAFVRLPREVEDGACYRYIPAIRNPILKAVCVGFGTFFQTLTLGDRKSPVIIDCLNRVAGLSALLGARLSGKQCIGIITEPPDMLSGGKFSKGIANFVIRHCTGYVFLTQALNDYVKNTRKPYVVMEGHSDISMKDRVPDPTKKTAPRVIFYAGGITWRNGLHNLVDGFRMASLENACLHLYGNGDYVPTLKKVAQEDDRVFYGGMAMNDEVVEMEQSATLLVNPRPIGEEYMKYCFPSKTMEYMASGTAVLTTPLPGIPVEYYPYVYLLRDETPEGIARTLEEILAQPEEDLIRKGSEARRFILEERNNVIQGKRILDMLKEM